MKIYTKTGDKGMTGLFGGARVRKDHLRVEAYGSVDELNSQLGLVRVSWKGDAAHSDLDDAVARIQGELFDLGGELARDPSKGDKVKVTEVQPEAVARLEASIDAGDAELPPLKTFILPGGHAAAAHLHVARTVCRRAERRLVTLAAEAESSGPVRDDALRYLNRLSDLLFTWARLVNHRTGTPDVPWVPTV